MTLMIAILFITNIFLLDPMGMGFSLVWPRIINPDSGIPWVVDNPQTKENRSAS